MEISRIIGALAQGFLDGGCRLSANYPGFHSNELHDALGGGVTSVNERTAYALAWGASLAGVRSVVSLKNVGLNDAADAFLNSLVTGVQAGLALVVFDDCDVQHSQNRLDSRHYFDFYGGLWLEPVNLQDAYALARSSFELSERFETPVVLRVTNVLYNFYTPRRAGHYERLPALTPPVRSPPHTPERFVVHPSHAMIQEARRQARQAQIDEYVETLHNDPPPVGDELTVVCGAGRSLFLDRKRFVRLRSLPLPRNYLRRLLADGRPVRVYEHGDPYVAGQLAALASGDRVRSVSMNNNDRLRHKYHCRSDWETLFGVLRDWPGRFVCGDLGGFTMDPHKTLDACLCYGASVAVGMGAAAAGAEQVFVVTGDAAFLHSGQAALAEAVARNVKLTVIVFDNGGARGTGGQAIPGCPGELPSGANSRFVDYAQLDAGAWRSLLGDCRGVTAIRTRTDF